MLVEKSKTKKYYFLKIEKRKNLFIINARNTFRSITSDIKNNLPKETIARKFHNVLVKAALQSKVGIDPLYLACGRKVLIFSGENETGKILAKMRKNIYGGKHTKIIGQIEKEHLSTVVMRTKIGSSRIIDMLSAEQLPRIC